MNDKPTTQPPRFGISGSYTISTPAQPATSAPLDVDAAFKSAEQLVQQQKFGEAFELCRKILDADPKHVRTLHMLGFLELTRGRLDHALDALKQSESLGNANPLMFMHLGIALSTQGDIDQALPRFTKAVAGAPKLAPARFNLGLTLSKAGRDAEAEQELSTTVELDPQHADAWSELATVRMKMSYEPEDLLETLEHALAVNPNHLGALNQKAVVLNSQDRVEDAIALMERALKIAPDRPELLVNYGDFLLDRDATKSVEAYRKAYTTDPAFPDAQAKLAEALERINKVDEARTEARAVLTEQPGSFLARLTLARCDQREKNFDAARQQLDDLLTDDLNAASYASVQKTRAIILDRQGKYAEAFQASQAANARLLENKPLTDKGQAYVYDPIKDSLADFTSERVAAWPMDIPSQHPDPVFFVGFPRSGTTLMEQILRAHPRFVAHGENEWIRKTMEALPSVRGADLDQLSNAEIENLRGIYWRQAQTLHGNQFDEKILVDKMPLNITHLGFIRRIFPRAKVLVAIRDPRDCILSGYMQNFHRVHAMDQFLTLETAAEFYASVLGLWLHHRDVLGMDVFEFRYEDLVASPKPMLEAALEFLGEDWDATVLQHEKIVVSSSATIATPSMRDVSDPIYTRAANRWPKYQDQLAPIVPQIQKFITAFGYGND